MKRHKTEQHVAEIAALVGGEVRQEYSGRGMYGAACLAIDCDDDLSVVEEAAKRHLPRPTIDSMGRGFICYWPQWETRPARESAT